jgi:tetratricopeptide (TPR) repeat protein
VTKLATLALLAAGCSAQFAPSPQANSAEEFDSYLAVLAAEDPAATIAAGDAFLRAWPDSGLRGHVYERQFEAYRRLGDSSKAILAGESALAGAPDNLMVLADLSLVLANGTTEPKRLARSEECARKAIALSKSMRIPRFIAPGEWAQTAALVNSRAHAALGLVAYGRADISGAIRELEAAVALAPRPDGTQYYRLGMLYRISGNIAAAKDHFRQAARSEEAEIQDLANRELRQLERR